MIRIQKEPEPKSLVRNAKVWTAALLEENLEDPVPKKYRSYYAKKDIKEALAKEANEKCAYCERRILANQHGDVEHIQPISKERAKMFEWSNLVLACQICNGNKSDKEAGPTKLIHPVLSTPSDELVFDGITIHSDSIVGLSTIDAIGLNRSGLLTDRLEKIEIIRRLINQYRQALCSEKQEVIAFLIRKEMDRSSEFSASVSGYVRRQCPELANNL